MTEHAEQEASSCVKWPRWVPAPSTCADSPKPRLSESGAAAIQHWAATASKAASRQPNRLDCRISEKGLSICSNRIPHLYYAPVPKTLGSHNSA